MCGFSDPLRVEQSIEGKWILRAPLRFTAPATQITVPAGFVTDLASVPRLFWGLVSPWDVAKAAVIHDYLYARLRSQCGLSFRQRHAQRFHADSILLLAMNYSTPPVPAWRRWSVFVAVLLFAWRAAYPKRPPDS